MSRITTKLPKTLIEALNTVKLTKKEKNKSIKLLDLMMNKYRNDWKMYNEYIEMGQNYLTIIFDKHYYKFFNKLKSSGIIEENKIKKFKVGAYCKSYRINNNLLSNSSSSISYINNKFNHLLYTCTPKTLETLGMLNIQKAKLYTVINKIISNIKEDSFIINEEIDVTSCEQIDMETSQKHFVNVESHIKAIEGTGAVLLQDGKKFYTANLDEYINHKKQMIKVTYQRAIDKLAAGHFYANRNDTNGRLDTNITSLLSSLLDVIKQDNDLVEIDLKNSQFSIFSHITKDETADDFKLFNELSSTGGLYTHIQDELGLETRKEAKEMMFLIAFSSWKFNSQQKNKIKELFPTVFNWIKQYKVYHGSKNFPIMLQETESEIFIDNILPRIMEENLFVLSKHDSVLVKRKDVDKVMSIMQDYFLEIDFDAVLDVDGSNEIAKSVSNVVEVSKPLVKEVPAERLKWSKVIESNNNIDNSTFKQNRKILLQVKELVCTFDEVQPPEEYYQSLNESLAGAVSWYSVESSIVKYTTVINEYAKNN